MSREVTEIRVDESGDETHESWVLIRANRVSSTGTRLFDSEIAHQHFVAVRVVRCSRRRDLHHDRLYGRQILLEVEMSMAQWGAFVSSFGMGDGVPATLTYLGGEGDVPRPPDESRLAESFAEIRDTGSDALAAIQEQYDRVLEAFESGGKRALREELVSMGHTIRNGPLNMEFAAKTLVEHAENVTERMRADIEGMVLAAMEQGVLSEGTAAFPHLELERGDGS